MAGVHQISPVVGLNDRAVVTALSWSFLALLSVSMIFVSQDVEAAYHIKFDPRDAWRAALSVCAFACCIPLIAASRAPLGFAASFYLLSVAAGYLWLSYFTPLEYDHTLARFSVVASWVAFALPAVFIAKRPTVRDDLITRQQMHIVCGGLIFLSAAILVYGYLTSFLLGPIIGEQLRGTFPTWMRYAVGISTSTLLPFSYAWFYTEKKYAIAAAVLALLLAFYLIALNKTVMLAAFWLIFLTVLLKLTSWRVSVVLSLLLPTIIGLIVKGVDPDAFSYTFRLINFRMLAIPASGIDHYNHFFSTHPVTYFCQISVIGRAFNCALSDPLAVRMANEYATGNYNASLLAEGIASLGVYLAPISAILCGGVIALGNSASARLEPGFVLLSGAMLIQLLMNIPLSTVMVTHGGVLMFGLWLLTPRTEQFGSIVDQWRSTKARTGPSEILRSIAPPGL